MYWPMCLITTDSRRERQTTRNLLGALRVADKIARRMLLARELVAEFDHGGFTAGCAGNYPSIPCAQPPKRPFRQNGRAVASCRSCDAPASGSLETRIVAPNRAGTDTFVTARVAFMDPCHPCEGDGSPRPPQATTWSR